MKATWAFIPHETSGLLRMLFSSQEGYNSDSYHVTSMDEEDPREVVASATGLAAAGVESISETPQAFEQYAEDRVQSLRRESTGETEIESPVGGAVPRDQLLERASISEGPFYAVPKVVAE